MFSWQCSVTAWVWMWQGGLDRRRRRQMERCDYKEKEEVLGILSLVSRVGHMFYLKKWRYLLKCVEGVFVHISYTFLNDSFLVLEVFDLAASASNQVRADLLSQWCRDGGILIISYSLFRIIVSYRGRSRRLKSIFNESLINPGEGNQGAKGGHS